MPVYLPIAEMSVNAFEIMFLGVVVGFFSGLFGVGGGFLALPLLVFIGIPPTVAVTTQSCQILASSTAGVVSEWKRGRVDVPLALHMMAGGAGGLLFGLAIFHLLRFVGQIDFAIS
ncbi:MAG: TSUP family transporter, partial [Alphaproteobacteria bacterium]|nr:TSUP family transporter [Alphaproteobacteria bacterium]